MSGNVNNRIASLDGLRAVAILMVIFSHAAYTCHFPSVAPYVFYFFNGELGVRIFFVISGFIITHLLLKDEDLTGQFSIRSFYLRRIFRILPVYLFFLMVVYLLSRYVHTDISNQEFLAALTFTTGWWDKSTWLLGHTWSLSVEEQFYLWWPVSLFLIRSKRLRYISTMCAIILFPIIRVMVYVSSWREKAGYIFITQGDAILMGCLLALLLFYEGESIRKWFTQYLIALRLLGIGCIVALNMLSGAKMMGWITVPFSISIQSFIIAWLMATFILNKDILFNVLNSKVMIFMGVISYSWYLWQQLFLFECNRFFEGALYKVPFNIIASFGVAVMSYYAIEKTMERVKRSYLKQ